MLDSRKRAVSLRLSAADLKPIKRVSQRLGVRNSDVIRYAIKSLLFKLSALSDPSVKGRSLVPLFLEGGADLVHNFDLDAARLGAIINEGADEEQVVSVEDLHMLAMTGGAGAQPAAAGNGHDGKTGTVEARAERRGSPMRRYLYEKYLYRTDSSGPDHKLDK